MTTREELAPRSREIDVSVYSGMQAYRKMRAMLSTIADKSGIVLHAQEGRAILNEAFKRFNRRAISEIASSSPAGLAMAAAGLARSLDVYTVAHALGHILAPETLGADPQTELMRRAEALLDAMT